MLMDVVECQVALPPDDGSCMLYEFFQDGDDVAHQIISEEVPEKSEGGHNHKGILILQVLNYGIIHEEAQLVPWLYKECCQQVCHFFEIVVVGLTEVDRENMSKGGVIAQCLKVDELDEDIRVLFHIAGVANLHLYVLDLTRY